MNLNPASIIAGPAKVIALGTTFIHRGTLNAPLDRSTIDINDIGHYGVTFRSHDKVNHPIDLTPSGRILEATTLANRYANVAEWAGSGRLINVDVWPVTCNAGTEVITVPSGTGLATGDEVMAHAAVEMPGGVSATTRYYWRSLSGTTGALYDSAANAADTENTTGRVDITSAGTGVFISKAHRLVLHFMNGLKITYYSAGVIKPSNIRIKAGETLLGPCGFMAFLRPGTDPDDTANAYHAITWEAFDYTGFDPDDMPREYGSFSWAKGAPWNPAGGLPSEDGIELELDLQTKNIPLDCVGEDQLGKRFGSLDAKLTAGLRGVPVKAAADALAKARGGDLSGEGAITIESNTLTLEVADAALLNVEVRGSSEESVTGDFVFQSTPSFTDGVPNPLYELTENE